MSLIGDNLTDETIRTSTGSLPLSTTLTQGTGIAYDNQYARPRNYTLRSGIQFLDFTLFTRAPAGARFLSGGCNAIATDICRPAAGFAGAGRQ